MPSSDVIVVIRYRAQPGEADRAVRELGALIATVVREEPDCRGIQLCQNTGDPTRILLYELWTSQAAYSGPHLETPHIRAFIGRAPGFLAGPPEITYWTLRRKRSPAPLRAVSPKSFRTARAFGAWLRTHHATERELLLRLFKVQAKDRGIGYTEALDEALCWGWIDGVVRRYDADSYLQRFTPRKPRSIWSVVNVGHVKRLIAEGRMQPPGLAAFEARTAARTGVYAFEQKDVELAGGYASRFRGEKDAWGWFSRQTPYYRRTCIHWVMSAKREETRLRRLGILIDCSREELRIPSQRPAEPRR